MKHAHVLCAGLMISICAAGCIDEAAELQDEQEPTLSETSSELTIGGHYCVDQSYASADRLGDYVNVCWRSPSWSTTLSNGHKVTAVTNCSDFSSAYAIVYSHWNGVYYYMRKDAFRPC